VAAAGEPESWQLLVRPARADVKGTDSLHSLIMCADLQCFSHANPSTEASCRFINPGINGQDFRRAK
jgi:hypothetical protein